MSLLTPAALPGNIGPTPSHNLERWFVVYTSHNHEKRVAEHFRLRHIESYLPLYRADRAWKNGCTARLELPLFPGYVFVKIAPWERVSVLQVPSVIAIVGNGRQPTPLPDAEMESLRNGLGRCSAQPHPFLNKGCRARIRCGPLQGLEGVVLWNKSGPQRVRLVLTVDAISSSVAVEVSATELELIGSAA